MRKYGLLLISGLFWVIERSAFGQEPTPDQTSDAVIYAIISALTAVAAALAAVISAIATLRSDKRAQKTFDAQNVPMIQNKPIRFLVGQPTSSAATTILELNNYSLTDAYDVDWDVKYGGDWIMSWIETKAIDLERKQNRTPAEEMQLNIYKIIRDSSPIPTLKPGTVGIVHIAGSVPADLCWQARPGKSFPIQVKTSWQSKTGQSFSRLIEYDLVCTRVDDTEEYQIIGGRVLSQDL